LKGAIPLVVVGVSLATEVVATVVSLTVVVPLATVRCPVSIDVHGDQGVIHPPWGIGQVVLGHILSLWVRVVPLWTLLLRGKGSEVSISSEHISEEYLGSDTSQSFLGVFLVCNGHRIAHYVFGYISR